MADDGTYITIASVRRMVGITSTSTISDSDVGDIIAESEAHIPKHFNTVFTPKERTEIQNGNGTNRIMLRKNPVLAVRDLYIDGTQEDTANLNIYKQSGKIELSTSATATRFTAGSNKVVVKYLYGWLEESSTDTTTSSASTAGTSVALSVASESGFSADDWVEIYGMDGHREVAQVTATDTGEITVDQLVQTHVSGSTVILLQVNEIFKKLMRIIASISIVARIVGQSATDTVGYDLSELHVQKGEPYTQWRETATQLIRERDRLMEIIKPRPIVI